MLGQAGDTRPPSIWPQARPPAEQVRRTGEAGREFGLCDEFGDEFEEGLKAEAEAFDGDSLVVPVKKAREAGVLG